MDTIRTTTGSNDALLIEISTLARKFAGQIVRAADADDLAQDIVLECMTKMESGTWPNEMTSLEGFIWRMVTCRAIDARRSNNSRARRDVEYQQGLTEIDREWMTSDYGVEEKTLRAIREQAEASLPPMCRRVFFLIREGELSYKEVADRLGISASAVRWHLVEAQRRLRIELASHGIEVPPARKRPAPGDSRPDAQPTGEPSSTRSGIGSYASNAEAPRVTYIQRKRRVRKHVRAAETVRDNASE